MTLPLAQVIERLDTGLVQDRRQRAVAALLWGASGGVLGWGVGHLWPTVTPLSVALPCAIIGGAVAAAILWRSAPDHLAMARRADGALHLDRAVETAIEGALKARSPTDLTPLLHARVAQATQGLTPAILAPWRIGRPFTALCLAGVFAIGAQFVPMQTTGGQDTFLADDLSHMQDSLAAIAALRDSADPALVALAREAEALAVALQTADPTERAAIAAALGDLQDQAARILGTDIDSDRAAAINRLSEALAERATDIDVAEMPPDDQAPFAIEEVTQETIDAPENTMNTAGQGANYEAVQDNNLECEFGDVTTCQVEDGGAQGQPGEPLDDDIPEQIRADELTEGGEGAATDSTSTGDAGATGTARSALYGTAELLPAPEAAFTADSLMLGADNPLGEGQRTEIDIPTTFDMTTPASSFPDAPQIGQDNWRRAREAPVARSYGDAVLNRALADYYPAPEDWR